jgi:hypothetical protein
MTDTAAKLHEYFTQNGFLPVGRDAYPIFKDFKSDSVLIDMTPTLINTWGVPLNTVYKNILGHICIVWFCDGSPFHNGTPIYFTLQRPSGGSSLQEIVDTLYDLVTKAGLSFLPIESIDESFLGDYSKVKGYNIKTEYTDDHSEYLYSTKNIIELEGSAHRKKRSRLAKYLKRTDIELVPITKENVNKCLTLQEEWCGQRECSFCSSFAGCEKKALEVMVDIFNSNYYGGALGYIEGKLVGYLIWDIKNKDVSYMYFGKSIVQDFFAYIVYMTTKTYLYNIDSFNFSEDMGNLGVRSFKQHLGEYTLLKKYLCEFSKQEK